MRFPHLGVRHRILAACLIISLSAVAAMAVFGFSLRSVLRARARESCICIAELFADQAHHRLINLAGEGLRRLQTGLVRNYALAMLVGVVAVLAYFVVRSVFGF